MKQSLPTGAKKFFSVQLLPGWSFHQVRIPSDGIMRASHPVQEDEVHYHLFITAKNIHAIKYFTMAQTGQASLKQISFPTVRDSKKFSPLYSEAQGSYFSATTLTMHHVRSSLKLAFA